MKENYFLIGLLVLFLLSCDQQKEPVFKSEDLALIPQPQKLTLNPGCFQFTEATVFVVSDSLQPVTTAFRDKFKSSAGWNLEIQQQAPAANYVQLTIDKSLKPVAYSLTVTSEFIDIKAASAAGFRYALETLRQLLPVHFEQKQITENDTFYIPNLTIEDAPGFKWRGLMLDVSRHFFEKDYILKTIDRLALLKMNTLHLHLVDDQGWRIEIKKYPKLTEVGAFRVNQEDKHWNARAENNPDEKGTYGGFYTQEDIKEIVAYATQRGITVVPEIEMPAHVMSAIAAYPFLSCTQKPIGVPSGGVWPITEIYCPGKETTFKFLEEVLSEVIPLFPSKYIHVGGDEATKTNWETCPDCQRRMKEEHLEDTDELQSYFMKRMERFLEANDKVLIGWDEILEGGLPPSATVMSWRGTKGGWEASKAGHDVIMTPENPMYFNFYQGNPDVEPLAFDAMNTLEQVYDFSPIIDSMSVSQKNHVLGAQANLWSEYITTQDDSEYMIFPRITALAEVLWSANSKPGWDDYTSRLQRFLPRLDALEVNYSRSVYNVEATAERDTVFGGIRLQLASEMPQASVLYALDNEELNANAKVYNEPFTIDSTTTLTAAVFENGAPAGRVLSKTFNFHKAAGSTVTLVEQPHRNYRGAGGATLVNVLRGSKNFHDGQWLGWLATPVTLLIDLNEVKEFSKVRIGALENQGAGIYFPSDFKVSVSKDSINYATVGQLEHVFKANGASTLKTFTVETKVQKAQFIKVEITTYIPENKRGVFTFLDELVIE